MTTLLLDAGLLSSLSVEDSALARSDWRLVGCGGDWLKAIRIHEPRIVILDHDPPLLDAVPLIEELRAYGSPSHALPLVCQMPVSELRVLYPRFEGWQLTPLVPPVDPDLLAACVTRLLGVPRRRHPRAAVSLALHGMSTRSSSFYGRVLNLSEGGFLLETAARLREADLIYCFMELTDDTPTLSSVARVVRHAGEQGSGYRYGLSFEELCDQDRMRIAQVVASCSSDRRHAVYAQPR